MISHNFNPGARKFDPNGGPMGPPQERGTPHQVSAPPSPYLETRIFNLEEEHADLRDEVHTLKDLYHNLCNSFGKVERNGQNSGASSGQDVNLDESRQGAMQLKHELERLSREVRESVHGDADNHKVSGRDIPKAKGSIPPHLRAASVTSHGSGTKSVPPHLRNSKQPGTANGDETLNLSVDIKKHSHEPLVTDGPVDTIVQQTNILTTAPSSPLSLTTTVQCDAPLPGIEDLSVKEWKPYYLTTLASLPAEVRAKIPTQENMATFSFDMLQNLFGGISWSPGLRYINSAGPCLLQNRTYYMLDPTNEPYLPKVPGEHGAKLTAFFNKAPEEEFGDLPDGTSSYTNVPLFVQVAKGRYAYFGNYSQTRWSDKLDNETMRAHVPQTVKLHIATELTVKLREKWVTRELKKHFFPKPEYEGSFVAVNEDNTTVNSVDEAKQHKQMEKDVRGYIEDLAEWDREAKMKTAMIKPDFILHAFDAADADDPPALRLWWEYLECVDWKLDFYNMLTGLQARADNPK